MVIYENPTACSCLMLKDWNASSWEQTNDRAHSSPLLFIVVLEVLVRITGQEKGEGTQIGKEVVTILICKWDNLICRTSKEPVKKLLQLINSTKWQDSRSIYIKSVVFLYINKPLEHRIKKNNYSNSSRKE